MSRLAVLLFVAGCSHVNVRMSGSVGAPRDPQ
jgi:hypothetical protein